MTKKKEKKHNFKFKLLVTFLFIILIIIGLTIYSSTGLEVKEYSVINNKIPESFHGIKIVHFSDLHYQTNIKDNELKNIINKINSLKPDIVVFTGDLLKKEYNINENEKNYLIKALSNIKCNFKYAVLGNHDYEFDSEPILTESNFKILKNSYEEIYYLGNTPIVISGLPSLIKDSQNIDETLNYMNVKNYNLYSILLVHEPDSVKNITNKPDLILAGHSHGGQIKIPFVGTIYTPIGSKKYYGDHYSIDNSDLFVSSGLGTALINIRFLNKPSINLIRLYNH